MIRDRVIRNALLRFMPGPSQHVAGATSQSELGASGCAEGQATGNRKGQDSEGDVPSEQQTILQPAVICLIRGASCVSTCRSADVEVEQLNSNFKVES